ncbi:DUF4190 domain-containing protein [Quadrisphaera setariae]|uniref:DUF4190 domain-containing protein n=1 Tax=Quadrisphaera setariae TaxID=2593304 RepID=A0A5C8ZJY6_9ACTN|nr:DUF4190 domain-containing protein [Quadrisphaera setariae]TXR57488.1 DUF4190 domain-containing protein [Quadrisphaera setariae]
MSTQDPYGTSDQPQRTGSSPASGSQPSWQQSAPSGPSGEGYPAGPQQGGYQQPAPYTDGPGSQGGYPAHSGQGGYDRPAPKNGIGIAALILGILAIITGFFVIGGLLGLVAIVLGFIGSGRAKRGLATNRGMAITGIVLGAIGIVLTVAVVAFGAFIGSQVQDCSQLAASGASEQQVQQCIADQLGVEAPSN